MAPTTTVRCASFNRDDAMVQVVVLRTALAYTLLNLVADVVYVLVNARVKG